jgi:hypothetical protein
MGELGGVEKVVFNGISRCEKLRALEAGDGMDHILLDVEGQAVRGAVGIHFQHSPALGFNKHMMVGMMRKFDDLVLDRRTIADAGPFDQPAVERGVLEMAPDDIEGALGGMREPARDLAGSGSPGRKRRKALDGSTWNIGDCGRGVVGGDIRIGRGDSGLFHVEHRPVSAAFPAEKWRGFLAGLEDHAVVVQAVFVEPRRRAGFESFHAEPRSWSWRLSCSSDGSPRRPA